MKNLISVLKYTFSLALAGLLLYLAFRNIDLEEFIAKSKEVDYTWVIISIILSLVAYYARAYRWNILLKPLGYTKLSVHKTNLAILLGYLANLAFPRLGEVTRCGILKRTNNVSISESLGTVISERIIDMVTLLSLIAFALIIEYDRLIMFLSDVYDDLGDVEGLMWKGALTLGVGGVLFAALIYFLYQKNQKIRSFLNDMLRGLISLRKIENLPGFILSTIVLWVTYYFMSYIIVFSIPETADLTWDVGLMLLVTGGIALAIPVQGGIGTYHALVSSMLVLYSVDKTTGVFLATLLHTSQIVAVAIFGGIALVITFFLKKADVQHQSEDL